MYILNTPLSSYFTTVSKLSIPFIRVLQCIYVEYCIATAQLLSTPETAVWRKHYEEHSVYICTIYQMVHFTIGRWNTPTSFPQEYISAQIRRSPSLS